MTSQAGSSCPPEILEWIAWYPDGGLTDRQRGAVEGHAATCAACRDELAVLAGRAEAPVAPADPERLFAKVLARVEADELSGGSAARALLFGEEEEMVPAAGAPGVPGVRAPAPRRARAWSGRGLPLAAGLALAVLAGGVGGWLGGAWLHDEPVYRVASEPERGAAAPAADAVALDVVFRSDATAEQIQVALRGLGAQLTAGPTPLGRYRVELPPGADADAAAESLRATENGVASFAEPVRR